MWSRSKSIKWIKVLSQLLFIYILGLQTHNTHVVQECTDGLSSIFKMFFIVLMWKGLIRLVPQAITINYVHELPQWPNYLILSFIYILPYQLSVSLIWGNRLLYGWCAYWTKLRTFYLETVNSYCSLARSPLSSVIIFRSVLLSSKHHCKVHH